MKLNFLEKDYFLNTLGNKVFKKSIRKKFNLSPKKLKLYQQAFCHRSISPDPAINNERLEFLGDSVLNLIITDYLFSKFTNLKEGSLTIIRSKLTNRHSLNKLSLDLGVSDLLRCNKRIKNESECIYGNALEALIGAVYLDRGYNFTKKVILNLILNSKNDIEKTIISENNYKGRLIELDQKKDMNVHFDIEEIRQDKKTVYKVNVFINQILQGTASDKKKKNAEQRASFIAYQNYISEKTDVN